MFCKECGLKISDHAIACPKCGCPTNKENGSEKKNIVAFFLCWFFGLFGTHRFYVGKNGSAIAMLILTLTLFGMIISGIWDLVDFITIICGNFTDKDGKKLTW